MIKENKVCEFCSNQYDNNEAKKAYGPNSAVVLGSFCSKKCLDADKVKNESDSMVNAVDNKEQRNWSTASGETNEGLQFELAVYHKKDGQIYKLSCLDMRGRRFDCSAKTKTIYIRFADGILFNYTTDLATYYDSTKIKTSIDKLKLELAK